MIDHYYFDKYNLYPEMGSWLSVDPLAEKNQSVTLYNYCHNNPVMLVDPDGRDTVNVAQSSNGKWEITKTIIKPGNDVINVFRNGKTDPISYIFEEGENSKRIDYVRLEDIDCQTLGVYHLSGTDKTGFALEREGPSTFESGKSKRIPTGLYSFETKPIDGSKWRGYPVIYNDKLGKNRFIKAHFGTNYLWSTGCLIIGPDSYKIAKNLCTFDFTDSKGASTDLGCYLGASSFFDTNPNQEGQRSKYGYFEYKNNTNGNGVKLIIK